MLDRTLLRADLKQDEGYKPYAYQDSQGYWTIGSGILIDRRRGGGITQAEGDMLLDNRIQLVMDDLDREVPWWRNLSEVRQRALANMAFNLGVANLLKFKDTLRHLQNGQFAAATAAMRDSLWYTQVGARAKRLVSMMENG